MNYEDEQVLFIGSVSNDGNRDLFYSLQNSEVTVYRTGDVNSSVMRFYGIKVMRLLRFMLTVLVMMITSGTMAQQYFPVRDRMEVTSLDGTWDFRLDGEREWRRINVPGNWELQGVKTPDYGKDLKEVSGTYRRTFKYDECWKGRDVILRLDGVQNGFTVYVNGTEVGSGHSSHTMYQLNITKYLNSGENTIEIKVSSHSDYWLFDVCDAWSFTGIQHSVELFSVPREGSIADVVFCSSLSQSDTSSKGEGWEVRVDVDANVDANANADYVVKASLIDERYNHVADMQGKVKDGKAVMTTHLQCPRLWTAETPNLYRLDVKLCDGKGKVIQSIEDRVGIREIKVKDCKVLLNNKEIFLRGACLSENDAIEGSAMTAETFRRILLQMKEANINFIRTAHYPLNPAFNQLCDEMGFYVCEEIPFASRGDEYLKTNSPEVIAELKARAKATIDRDRNRPSIIMWTHGNENKIYSCQDSVLKFTMEYDPTRLRGVPQAKGPFLSFIKHPSKYVDVICGHYANDGVLQDACEKSTKPIINTEYAHSLGTATGELEHKYEIFRREPKIAGGSIWCYEDQSVLTHHFNQQNQVLKGVRVDSLRFIDNYGLNPAPEGANEVGKEGTDGIVYGDIYPSEDYFEVAQVYSPVKLEVSESSREFQKVQVKNLHDFISLNGFQLSYKVKRFNDVLEQGEIWLSAKAGEAEEVTVPVTSEGENLLLEMDVLRPDGSLCFTKSLWLANADVDANANANPNARTCSLDRARTLNPKNLRFALRMGRPLSIGIDYKRKGLWFPYMLQPQDVKVKKQKGGYRMTCRWVNPEHETSFFSGDIDIKTLKNGAVDVTYQLTPSDSVSGKVLDFGLTMTLPKEYTDVVWAGEGPFSHSADKHAYNNPGWWQLNKDDLRFYGNRGDVSILTAYRYDIPDSNISIVSDTKNLFLENIDGRINITDNINVSSYGTKFYGPETKSAKVVGKAKGHFVISPVTVLETTPANAENPYLESYGK